MDKTPKNKGDPILACVQSVEPITNDQGAEVGWFAVCRSSDPRVPPGETITFNWQVWPKHRKPYHNENVRLFEVTRFEGGLRAMRVETTEL